MAVIETRELTRRNIVVRDLIKLSDAESDSTEGRLSPSLSPAHSVPISDVDWDCSRTRMVACLAGERGGEVEIWERSERGLGNSALAFGFGCTESGMERTATWQAEIGCPLRFAKWLPRTFGSKIIVCPNSKPGLRIWGKEIPCLVQPPSLESSLPSPPWRLFSSLLLSFPSPVLDACAAEFRGTLMLACVHADGFLRVLHSSDALFLKHWTLQCEIDLLSEEVDARISRAKYAASSFSPVISNSAYLQFEPSPEHDKMPRLAVAVNHEENFKWNKLQVFVFDERRNAFELSFAINCGSEFSNQSAPEVRDLSWAPNMGRPFDLLAVGSSLGLSLFRIATPFPILAGKGKEDEREGVKVKDNSFASLIRQFEEHKGEVFSVSWDSLGSSLASAGADGFVRVWKESMNGEWMQQGAFPSL